VHLDRVGEDVDAAQDALARVAAEFYVLGCHGTTFFDVRLKISRRGATPRAASKMPQDVAFLHDERFRLD
jgi:hypothetical protein